MTAPEELDHEAGARFMEKLLAEDPARLDVATDDEVDAMMDRAGIAAAEPESPEQLLARIARRRSQRHAPAPAPAPASALAPALARRSPARRAWVAGAVVAAAAAAVVAVEVTSHRGPEAIGPEPPSPPLTPQQLAARLRRDALTLCTEQDFPGCAAKLDEAKGLDPAGEADPRVVQMRAQLAEPAPSQAPSWSPDRPDKPPLRPLKPR